jgi:hypothetical protein
LQQIGKTTDRYALQAVAKGLEALPIELAGAQAQQARIWSSVSQSTFATTN